MKTIKRIKILQRTREVFINGQALNDEGDVCPLCHSPLPHLADNKPPPQIGTRRNLLAAGDQGRNCREHGSREKESITTEGDK